MTCYVICLPLEPGYGDTDSGFFFSFLSFAHSFAQQQPKEDKGRQETYLPGRSHITNIPPYFLDHSTDTSKNPFCLISSKLPRNSDRGGPGRFRRGDINASKNKNLQINQARRIVGTAKINSFHSKRLTISPNAAIIQTGSWKPGRLERKTI